MTNVAWYPAQQLFQVGGGGGSAPRAAEHFSDMVGFYSLGRAYAEALGLRPSSAPLVTYMTFGS